MFLFVNIPVLTISVKVTKNGDGNRYVLWSAALPY